MISSVITEQDARLTQENFKQLQSAFEKRREKTKVPFFRGGGLRDSHFFRKNSALEFELQVWW